MTQPALHMLESAALFVAMIAAEAMLIAQAAAPTAEAVLMPLLQSFGIPGAWLAVIAYTIRKIVLWGIPVVERIVEAHIARQATMAECQERLTASTIEIQKKNHEILLRLEGNLPRLCQAQPVTTKLPLPPS